MGMNAYARQLRAAQRAYEAECDCCDHGPREPAPEPPEPQLPDPHGRWADYAYSAGPSDLADHNRAESARLARILGDDWMEGLPI